MQTVDDEIWDRVMKGLPAKEGLHPEGIWGYRVIWSIEPETHYGAVFDQSTDYFRTKEEAEACVRAHQQSGDFLKIKAYGTVPGSEYQGHSVDPVTMDIIDG